MPAALPTFRPLPPANPREALPLPPRGSRADTIVSTFENYRRKRAAGIAEFLANAVEVTSDALRLDLNEAQLDTFVDTLRRLEIDSQAQADLLDLEGRRGLKQAVKAGLGDLRGLIASQHQLTMRQQAELCEALRDLRFRFIAEIDRKKPSSRGEALTTGAEVDAYLGSLRKR